MEYKKYPIYQINARWSQDGDQDPKYPKWYKGLPEGRIWNSSGSSMICKEEKTEEELNAILNNWWENLKNEKNEIKNSKYAIINPEIQKLEIKLLKFDSWNCTWFSHETFDEGQTDQEALDSFEEYVRRIEQHNQKCEWEGNEKDMIALMGAEDRWRWEGLKTGDPNDNTSTPPPCRCKYCKEQGKIRINH